MADSVDEGTKVLFDKDYLVDGTLTPTGPHVDVQAQVLAMLAEGEPIAQIRPDNEQNDALDAVITPPRPGFP